MDQQLSPEDQEAAELPQDPAAKVPLSTSRYIKTNYMDPVVWSQMRGVANTFFESGAIPKGIQNAPQLVMILQAGYEMGLPPIQAMNSFSIINGAINLWGKAVPRELRKHGWQILPYSEDENSCTATIRKIGTDEEYSETFRFKDAEASGWTIDSYKSLKPGWRPGQNRKLKMRYGALSALIKTYIPEVLGGASDIAEVAMDYQIVEVVDNPVKEKPAPDKKVLTDFINKKKQSKERLDTATPSPKVPPVEKAPEEPPLETKVETLRSRRSKRLFALLREQGPTSEIELQKIKKQYKVESFKDLSLEQIEEIIKTQENKS